MTINVKQHKDYFVIRNFVKNEIKVYLDYEDCKWVNDITPNCIFNSQKLAESFKDIYLQNEEYKEELIKVAKFFLCSTMNMEHFILLQFCPELQKTFVKCEEGK